MTSSNASARPLKITDTTFRDAHQSLFATRMRTEDMEPIAAELDSVGFHSVEVWGGATFDVCTRFLAEDPWDRIKRLKKLMPKTPFQMLLRGQNLVGYRNYPDDVVEAFVAYSAECGMDIYRVFDALNDERNLITAAKAIKKCGKHFQATICYSVTEEGRLGGPVFNMDYWVKKALAMRDMGADSLCLKDMAGLLAPYDAYNIIKTLKGKLHIPIQLHMHYTSGMASMTALKAVEAGIDIVDACLAPFALRTSQPAVEPLITSLKGTPRATGIDIERLVKIGDRLESIAPKYLHLLQSNKAGMVDVKVLSHQIPGGMTSNLISQLKEADALNRLEEVLNDLPLTRKELGYPPLVTPTSQIVGTQAVSNVLFGRYKMVSKEVKDYAYGLYGKPPAAVDPDVVKKVLKGYPKGETPITGRPADYIDPELEKAKADTKDIAKNIGDVLIYALYPTTGMKFLRMKYGLEPIPPEMQPKTLEQAKKELEEAAKPKAIAQIQQKSAEMAPPKSARSRTFNVYIGDEFYQVEVDPASNSRNGPSKLVQPASGPTAARPAAQPKPKAAEVASAELKVGQGQKAVEAPMPGIVIRYTVEVGQKVKAGDSLVILEAMKMENSLPSPADGTVSALACQPGTRVAKNTILAIIDT